MVTDLVHLNNLEKLSQSQYDNNNVQPSISHPQLQNPSSGGGGGSWMWNPSHRHNQRVGEEEESWEVRAFAEDTGNVLGTTWPPRSYTCTFCRREFRSAQALGGHMNVHRRDRARLHQGTATASFLPSPDLITAASGGLCFLYQLPPLNHNAGGAVYSGNIDACNNNNNFMISSAGEAPASLNHRQNYYSPDSSSIDYKNNGSSSTISAADNMEELDLELRL